jgi:hypothetical protein
MATTDLQARGVRGDPELAYALLRVIFGTIFYYMAFHDGSRAARRSSDRAIYAQR